jgi:hypothetical protein
MPRPSQAKPSRQVKDRPVVEDQPGGSFQPEQSIEGTEDQPHLLNPFAILAESWQSSQDNDKKWAKKTTHRANRLLILLNTAGQSVV